MPPPDNRSQRRFPAPEGFVFAIIALLCLQLCWSLSSTWLNGEYYGYGWFVPVLAAGLAWRRWRMLDMAAPATSPLPGSWVALGFAAVALIMFLRCLATVDPGWRPPVLLQALLTCLFCHGLLAKLHGWRISIAMLPVTVFALSAVPYPWQVEQHLIRSLTGTVAALTRELFLLNGKPVELVGERLFVGTDSVGIADGCSGIRSLQSLVMVSLFFGELLLLPWPRRIALLAIGAACAVGLNVARAFTLASIHFSRGGEATDAAHDPVGHTAFALSALILFLSARFLANPAALAPHKVIRRTHVPTPSPASAGHAANGDPTP